MKARNQPLVTVMIPTYNQAEFIEKAIKSVLDQSYRNIEVIVGDDSSCDGTSLIVHSIHDNRLKYVYNKTNLGRVNNYRNLLYAHATGDYVVNLDGDDYYTNMDFISNAVNLIFGGNDVVAVTAQVTTASSSKSSVNQLPDNVYLSGVQIVKMLPKSEYFFMHMATIYCRKTAIQLDFYSSDVMSSDYESLYRLMLHGNVGFLHENVGVWRIHDINESSNTSPAKLFKNLSIWPSIFSAAKDFGMSKWHSSIKSAACVAYFASATFPRVSVHGNFAVISFAHQFFIKYKLASLYVLIDPKVYVRFVLSMLGYYRRKLSA